MAWTWRDAELDGAGLCQIGKSNPAKQKHWASTDADARQLSSGDEIEIIKSARAWAKGLEQKV